MYSQHPTKTGHVGGHDRDLVHAVRHFAIEQAMFGLAGLTSARRSFGNATRSMRSLLRARLCWPAERPYDRTLKARPARPTFAEGFRTGIAKLRLGRPSFAEAAAWHARSRPYDGATHNCAVASSPTPEPASTRPATTRALYAKNWRAPRRSRTCRRRALRLWRKQVSGVIRLQNFKRLLLLAVSPINPLRFQPSWILGRTRPGRAEVAEYPGCAAAELRDLVQHRERQPVNLFLELLAETGKWPAVHPLHRIGAEFAR